MTEIQEEDLNETELRLMYSQFGIRFPRPLSAEQINESFNSGEDVITDQVKIRTQTQKFVVTNWEFIKQTAEVYGCTGDCANPNNKCTDLRAQECFKECFPNKRKRRRNG
jgi:hypothetical protein